MKKYLQTLLSTIACFAALLSAVSLVLVLFGLRPFILKSGSMEPLYTTGSLVWVNTRTPVDDVNIGDVLIYRAETGALVMHRLVDDGTLKGDANQLAEHIELTTSNLEGKLAFALPVVGGAVDVLLSHVWLPWLVAGLFVGLSCLPWSRMGFDGSRDEGASPKLPDSQA